MAVPAETFPWHPRPWTLEEVLALPEDSGQRVELIDGTLVVSPSPTPTHQRVLLRLIAAFLNAVPHGMEFLPNVNVVLDGRRLLIPDLIVTNTPGHTDLYFTSAQIVLAVEVLSPSTRAYDRALKRQLYAEAGIEYYLVVDPAPATPSATLLRLDGDDYREAVRSSDGLLQIERPFPVEVDLGAGRRTDTVTE
jgi:Uma2 family endonuclease